MIRAVLASLACVLCSTAAFAADAVLVQDGKAKAAIYVSARVMDDATKAPEPASVWTSLKAEDNRRRLRESVRDLAAILERVSGVAVPIAVGPPPKGDTRVPILIGELATAKPAKAFPYAQGFRIVASETGVSLSGESDLATRYAIYTLLDQLGCRWFIPGPMGEVLPTLPTLKIHQQDLSTGPGTIYRGLWYCDNDFGRRNRLGGLAISAGHNIEFAVPKELRTKHPEIKAIINGKPHDHLIKWTHPLVADALSNACLDALKKDPELKTYSLSPDDGASWDESDDAKHDAGDHDPILNCVAKADRLMVLANRVASKVSAAHPDVRFGMLAYVDYTRAPVREKVHPSIVPQIAPITFSRAQPMTDDGEPNNKILRDLIKGWAAKVDATSFYFYAFYLAEVSAPNPMIGKWSVDIPFIYKHGKCKYWQPETLANFESCMHAHYLGLRMAWDTTQDPKNIIDELHAKFYGRASKEMAGYWHFIDDVWVKTPEYAGCGFGYLRRWTPERLKQAREFIDKAEKACGTKRERDRVQLASWSLTLFEKFMQMRRDLAAGEWGTLTNQVSEYRDLLIDLGEQYQAEYAFSRMGWTGKNTLNVRYFDAFYKETHEDASRIASKFDVLTIPPMRTWKYQKDQDKKGEANGWAKADFADGAWKATDVAVDTWSALGMHNYMGSVWYRKSVNLSKAAAGKKTFLWIGATDGRVKVFVNGQHIQHIDAKGMKQDSFTGHCQPASFDISAAIKDGENRISLWCTREIVNELGTGGLIAAPVVYREK